MVHTWFDRRTRRFDQPNRHSSLHEFQHFFTFWLWRRTESNWNFGCGFGRFLLLLLRLMVFSSSFFCCCWFLFFSFWWLRPTRLRNYRVFIFLSRFINGPGPLFGMANGEWRMSANGYYFLAERFSNWGPHRKKKTTVIVWLAPINEIEMFGLLFGAVELRPTITVERFAWSILVAHHSRVFLATNRM